MVLDECIDHNESRERVVGGDGSYSPVGRRCLKYITNRTGFIAIVQGGLFRIAEQSAEYLTALKFDGFAIGG